MLNHPNFFSSNAITSEFKELLRDLSDKQILELGSGRSAIAVFPKSQKTVRIDPYFAEDVPDGAAEEYWLDFGPRATMILDALDNELYELPLGWQDSLKNLVGDDEELASSNSTIQHLLNLGLSAKAAEIRRKVMATNLTDVVENALAEIQARDDER